MPGHGNDTTIYMVATVERPRVADGITSDGPERKAPMRPPAYVVGAGRGEVSKPPRPDTTTTTTLEGEAAGPMFIPPPPADAVPPPYSGYSPVTISTHAVVPAQSPGHTTHAAPFPHAYAQATKTAQQQEGPPPRPHYYPPRPQQPGNCYYPPYGGAVGPAVSQEGFQLVEAGSVMSMSSPHAGDPKKPQQSGSEQSQGQYSRVVVTSAESAPPRNRVLLCLSESMVPLAVMDILVAVFALGAVACIGYQCAWWAVARGVDYFVTGAGIIGLLASIAFAVSRLVRLCCSLATASPGRVFHGIDAAFHLVYVVLWVVAGSWAFAAYGGSSNYLMRYVSTAYAYIAGVCAMIAALLSLIIGVVAVSNFRRA